MTVKAGISRRIGGVATASLVGLLLGSCSTVPDELNPVAWYESVEDLVAGDGDREASDQIVITDADQRPVPGANEPFPNLSSVPGDAPRTMPADERRAVASALVADRQHARYTDEAIRRDTSDSPAAAPAAQSDFSQDFATQDFGDGSMPAASPAPRVEREVTEAPAAGIPDMARTETEMPRRPAPPTSWEGDPYAQYRDSISGGPSAPAAMTRAPASAPVTAAAPPPAAAPTMTEAPEEPAEAMTVAREYGDSEGLPWQEKSSDAVQAEMAEQPAPARGAPATAPAPASAPQPRDDISDAYAAYESVRAAARNSDRTPYQGAAASGTSSAYETYAAASRSERATPPPAPRMESAAPVASPYPNAPTVPAPARRESYEGVFSKYFQESGQPPAPQPSFPYQTSGYQPERDGQVYAGGQPAYGAGSDPVGVITFESSSSELSGNDLDVVRRIADAHQSYGGTVRVVGHASSRTLVNDPSRHKQENLRISLKRAQAVARALREDGVPENAIIVAAMSDAEPLYSEATPLGEAANRRAEIFFDYGTRSR